MQRILVSGCGLLCLVLCAIVLVRGNDEENHSAEKMYEGDIKSKNPTPNFAPDHLAYRLQQARQSRNKIRQALQKTVTKKFEKATLGQVTDFLSEESGINVHFNKIELDDLNIDSSMPVHDTEFRDVSIEIALRRVLQPLVLDWYIRDNVIEITSKEKATQAFYFQVYDAEHFLLPRTANSFNNYEMGMFHIGNQDENKNDSRDPTELLDIVRRQISALWEDEGEDGGSTSFIEPNLLVIRQTRKSHDEIGELMKTLEEGLEGKLNFESKISRHRFYPYEKDRRIRTLLNRKVDLDFKNKTLGNVIGYLQNEQQIDTVLDKKEIELLPYVKDLAVSSSTSYRMKNVRLGTALDLILNPLDMSYFIEDGSLQISSKRIVREMMFNVVYDVRDLVLSRDDESVNSRVTNSLIFSIQDGTEGRWDYNNYTGGSISFFSKGFLVIRQAEQAHAEIEMLLKELRKKRKPIPVKEKKIDPNELMSVIYPVDANDDPEKVKQAIEMVLEDAKWNSDASKNRILIVGHVLVVKAPHELQRKVERFLQKFFMADPKSGRRRGAGMSSIER